MTATATAPNTPSSTTPVVLWDVDGVLNPTAHPAGYRDHRYCGPGPDGTPVDLLVLLNPEHAKWIGELTAAGATHAWATAWGSLAATWIAPRLHPPAARWPVIDVGTASGCRFGHTYKYNEVVDFLGWNQPTFWMDDVFDHKDYVWAHDRTARGVPTVTRHIAASQGLTRGDIDAALTWVRATRTRASHR